MQARLIGSYEIAPGVRHFVFEAEGVERLEFVPGQFVSFSAEVEGKEHHARVFCGLVARGK